MLTPQELVENLFREVLDIVLVDERVTGIAMVKFHTLDFLVREEAVINRVGHNFLRRQVVDFRFHSQAFMGENPQALFDGGNDFVVRHHLMNQELTEEEAALVIPCHGIDRCTRHREICNRPNTSILKVEFHLGILQFAPIWSVLNRLQIQCQRRKGSAIRSDGLGHSR